MVDEINPGEEGRR